MEPACSYHPILRYPYIVSYVQAQLIPTLSHESKLCRLMGLHASFGWNSQWIPAELLHRTNSSLPLGGVFPYRQFVLAAAHYIDQSVVWGLVHGNNLGNQPSSIPRQPACRPESPVGRLESWFSEVNPNLSVKTVLFPEPTTVNFNW